jgi:hypothetical protein
MERFFTGFSWVLEGGDIRPKTHDHTLACGKGAYESNIL